MKNMAHYTTPTKSILKWHQWRLGCLSILKFEAQTSIQYNQRNQLNDHYRILKLKRKKAVFKKALKHLELLRVELDTSNNIEPVIAETKAALKKIADALSAGAAHIGRYALPENLRFMIYLGCREFDACKLVDFFENEYNPKVDKIAKDRNFNSLKIYLTDSQNRNKKGSSNLRFQIKQIRNNQFRALKKKFTPEKIEELALKRLDRGVELSKMTNVEFHLETSKTKHNWKRILRNSLNAKRVNPIT